MNIRLLHIDYVYQNQHKYIRRNLTDLVPGFQFPLEIRSSAVLRLECFIEDLLVTRENDYALIFVFQHRLRNYMSPKSSSPSTVSPPRCIWCLDSSHLFHLFGGRSRIYSGCYIRRMSESNLHLPPADSSCTSTCFRFVPFAGAAK